MKRKDFIKEYIDGIKEEINELIKENGSEMYSGVFEVIDELENDEDHWNELITDLEEDYKEEADYINMVLGDCIDRELMGRFGKQFGENLTKLGYKYDTEEECWNIKDKHNGEFLTCYGVVWDYWYDLDTDVRESVGEAFEREIEE
jgi:Fe-S oxidoreductase